MNRIKDELKSLNRNASTARKPKKIAILGATGHIAKNLIIGLAAAQEYELYLFSRSRDRMALFLEENQLQEGATLCEYDQFARTADYDVIINGVGIGDPRDLIQHPFRVFQITEQYDNLILDYLHKHPAAIYINLSSGAVYGSDFDQPATYGKWLKLDSNHLSTKEFYGISKLNMEAKHRSLGSYRIVDLRIFGFFSAFIDLDSRYLLTDIIQHLKSGEVLSTSADNIVRDYVHPGDFVQLIKLCMQDKVRNEVYDVYSLKPALKFEILDYFAEYHGLKYEIQDNPSCNSITGSKNNYYSLNDHAAGIGYQPTYTSLQSIESGYAQLCRNKNS
ncbi:NAD-dependent epimerase/dehydratase family protein [Paenibacillus silagei]|uniref:Nucleoside-diphosphate-sugar epimerase n=1 Tax=Paenibacillus silagei TaxID=1670801 RepID=A0ABS4NNM6_9BACL|nr:NAD(P)-dependent oxidoreductase [Paenibacillus silagei]MBP2111668.1 nucleoside-diphosphate-sugar epimerase [Paenibacillus silagei]